MHKRLYAPFFHVGSLPHAHGPARIDQGADNIVVACANNEFLVPLRCTSFHASDETGAHPDAGSAVSAIAMEERESALSHSDSEDYIAGGAYDSAAARPRPSAMPPAATTKMGSPVKGLLWFLQRSTTAGMRMEKAVSPVWPPPSPP